MSLYNDPIDTHGHTVQDAVDLYGSDLAWGDDIDVTGEADTEVFTATAHGLSVGAPVLLVSKTGGADLTAGTIYYVKTVPDANSFTLASDSADGATAAFSTDVTAGVIRPVAVASAGFDASSGDVYLAQSAAEVEAQIG